MFLDDAIYTLARRGRKKRITQLFVNVAKSVGGAESRKKK